MKIILFIVLVLLHFCFAQAEVCGDSSEGCQPDDKGDCGFYLAPSLMPVGGLGVFTAEKIAPMQKILQDDIVINVIDRKYHSLLRQKFLKRKDADSTNWILSKYNYDGSSTMAAFEADEVVSLPYSAAMMANTHPVMNNAQMQPPENTELVARYDNVEAGAFSNYHGMHLLSTRDIKPGEEIFVPYGDAFIKQDPFLRTLPSYAEYAQAESILKKFSVVVSGKTSSLPAEIIWNLFWMSNTKWIDRKEELVTAGVKSIEEIYNYQKENDNPVLEQIYKLVKGEMSSQKAVKIWDLITSVSSADRRVLQLLPKHVANVEESLKDGLVNASITGNTRSVAWLKENGICLDKLYADHSSIPQAGRGAFASKNMMKDEVIAPISLLQIERRFTEMYKSLNMDQHVWRKGSQLLLNYAFGHSNSSMLLVPYTPIAPYVNHGGENSNAFLRWSKLSNSTMLKESPATLISNNEAGLVMELVALRSIDENEEVTIDYGRQWEKVWNDYISHWTYRSKYVKYKSASKLNQNREWIRTESEMYQYPYPKNTMLMCFTSYIERKDGMLRWEESADVFNSTKYARPCDIRQRQFEETKPEGIYRKPLDLQRYQQMIKNKGFEDMYIRFDVVVHTGTKQGDLEISGFPRKALRFFDRSYTSDLHMSSNAFRHEIQLPEHMVPDKWRDLPPN